MSNPTEFLAASQITSVTPTQVTQSRIPATFTVTGSGFAMGLTLTLYSPGTASDPDGSAMQPSTLKYVSSSELTFTVPPRDSGAWNLEVKNPDGQKSNRASFWASAAPRPVINGISPATPTQSPNGQEVRIAGSGFRDVLTLTQIGGGTADGSKPQFWNTAEDHCFVTMLLNEVGNAAITIRAIGGSSNEFPFTVQPLLVNGISPPVPTPSQSDQVIRVDGGGFKEGLTATITPQSPDNPTITLQGPEEIHDVTETRFQMILALAAGSYSLQVTNPGGAVSNSLSFPVQDPLVAGLVPSKPEASGTPQTIQVKGRGFEEGLTVTLSGPEPIGAGTTPTTTLAGADQIQDVRFDHFVMMPVLTPSGMYSIQVQNANGSGSQPFSFQVVAPVVEVTGIKPQSPLASPTAQRVAVTGTNFDTGLTVTLEVPGGGAAPGGNVQVENVTRTSFDMVAVLPVMGNYSMQVSTPAGGSPATYDFSVLPAPVKITGVTPADPVENPSPQWLSVQGSGFQAGLTVMLKGQAVSPDQIENLDDTGFDMQVLLDKRGTYRIQVNNPDGGQSKLFMFRVGNAPEVTPGTPGSPMSDTAAP